ncbi:TCuncharacterized [Mya arenaria]|uniref:TCuncharacterized n=1 Tax=Mya arenaria TaxID=6604 RepID=A0ABY7FZ25_MYAAR|nr:TCuncharacterized [Mya arenaria]
MEEMQGYYGNRKQQETQLENEMWVLTVVCLCVSLISLVITFIVYCLIPSLRSLPGLNNMALVGFLFLSQTLSLINSVTDVTNTHLCSAIGLILHWSLVSGFAWMFVCTFHMLKVFVLKMPNMAKSSSTHNRNFIVIFAKLSTLTGISWVFGFLYEFTASQLCAYLFIILNAGQGVFVMLSFVVNERVYTGLRAYIIIPTHTLTPIHILIPPRILAAKHILIPPSILTPKHMLIPQPILIVKHIRIPPRILTVKHITLPPSKLTPKHILIPPRILIAKRILILTRILTVKYILIPPRILTVKHIPISPRILTVKHILIPPRILTVKRFLIPPRILTVKHILIPPRILTGKRILIPPRILTGKRILIPRRILTVKHILIPPRILTAHSHNTKHTPRQKILTPPCILTASDILIPQRLQFNITTQTDHQSHSNTTTQTDHQSHSNTTTHTDHQSHSNTTTHTDHKFHSNTTMRTDHQTHYNTTMRTDHQSHSNTTTHTDYKLHSNTTMRTDHQTHYNTTMRTDHQSHSNTTTHTDYKLHSNTTMRTDHQTHYNTTMRTDHQSHSNTTTHTDHKFHYNTTMRTDHQTHYNTTMRTDHQSHSNTTTHTDYKLHSNTTMRTDHQTHYNTTMRTDHQSHYNTTKRTDHQSHFITTTHTDHQTHYNTTMRTDHQTHYNTTMRTDHQSHSNTTTHTDHKFHSNTTMRTDHQTHYNTTMRTDHQSHSNTTTHTDHQSHSNTTTHTDHQSHSNTTTHTDHQSHSNTTTRTDHQSHSNTTTHTDHQSHSNTTTHTDHQSHSNTTTHTDHQSHSNTTTRTDHKLHSNTTMRTDHQSHSNTTTHTDHQSHSNTTTRTDHKLHSNTTMRTDHQSHSNTTTHTDHQSHSNTTTHTDHKLHSNTTMRTDHQSHSNTTMRTDHQSHSNTTTHTDHKLHSNTTMRTDHQTHYNTTMRTDHQSHSNTTMHTDHQSHSNTTTHTDHQSHSNTTTRTDHKLHSNTTMRTDHQSHSNTTTHTDHQSHSNTTTHTDHKLHSNTTMHFLTLCPHSEICTDSSNNGEHRYVRPGGLTPCCGPCLCRNCDKDCCPGVSTSPITEEEIEGIRNRTVECVYPQVRLFNTFKYNANPVEMVVRCHEGYNDNAVKTKCETNYNDNYLSSDFKRLHNYIPISLNMNQTVFKNSHCAKCHGISEANMINWKAVIVCTRKSKITPHIGRMEDIPKLLDDDFCNVIFEPENQSAKSSLTKCEFGISRCNQTGEWITYDSFLEQACLSYTAIYRNQYKNIHCALCNTHGRADVLETCKNTCHQLMCPKSYYLSGDECRAIVGADNFLRSENAKRSIEITFRVQSKTVVYQDLDVTDFKDTKNIVGNDIDMTLKVLALNISEYEHRLLLNSFDGANDQVVIPVLRESAQSICLPSVNVFPTGMCPIVALPYANATLAEYDPGIDIAIMDKTIHFYRWFLSSDGQQVYVCCEDYFHQTEYFQGNLKDDKGVNGIDNLTIVVLSLSLGSLSITFMVFCLLPSLRNLPGLNNMALVVSLFFSNFLVLINALTAVRNTVLCQIIGLLLHWTIICSFSWMFLCTYHMMKVFLTITDYFAFKKRNIQFRKYILFAITASTCLILTQILASFLRTETIGYGGRPCYIVKPKSILYYVAIPAGIVVIVNIAMFGSVVYRVSSLPEIEKGSSNHDRNNLTIFVKLSTITGMTWIFGFLYQLIEFDLFAYLFVILTAGQGVFIMISFVMNERVFRGLCVLAGKHDNATSSAQTTLTPKSNGKHASLFKRN